MRRTGWTILACACGAFAAGRPFSQDDWWQFREAHDPRIAANGSRVVYVEAWNDREHDAFRSNLWIVSADGKNRGRLTEGPWRDCSPRWSPDATRLAYLSNRGGSPGIRIRTFDSGQEVEIANGQQALTLAWSPDGKWLAYTAAVPIMTAPPAWAPLLLAPLLARSNESRIQLFVVPANGGAGRQLTTGTLNHQGEPAWMGDGRSILISAAPAPDAANVLDGGEIYSIRVVDGARTQLTHHRGPDESPTVSPDGSRIAWLAREAAPQSYLNRKLYVMNADGSRIKVLAGALDRDVRHPQWSSDSRTIYFLADDHGATYVYSARNDGGVRQVTLERQRLAGLSLGDNGRAVSVRSTSAAAGEVMVFPVDVAGPPILVAAPAQSLLAERAIGRSGELQWISGGQNIQGWLTYPPAFESSKKYPLVVDVEDAPRRMCGPEFQLRRQILAAAGYVVLCANPRGTPGYGEAFGNLIHSRYPGDDFDDLMRAVDAVVAKGFVDTHRLTLVGGLLAAWALGHTNRFSAVVARRPIADWVTHVALAPDGLAHAAAWMGAMPWEDPEQYTKHSPLSFAQNFQTPTLVIGREHDTEAEQLYFALHARKVEAELVRMRGPETPGQMALELEATLAWFSRFAAAP